MPLRIGRQDPNIQERNGQQRVNQQRRSQRGHALVEFALVSVFMVPLFVGMAGIGINLTRSVTVSQVVRDAGLMYARFVDFSLDSNKDILERLAVGTGFEASGGTGKGVLMFTKVTYIDDEACTGAALSGSACTNRGQYVMTQRVVVGNQSLKSSQFGTPNSNLLDAKGTVANYMKETSARATGFNNLLTMSGKEFAFVAEGFFKGVSFKFGLWPTAEDIYTVAMF
jgi:hypothetical protein